ncbi:hypothetical protein BASA61_004312 [Batrachochytrium salamandrivorans]|nr:hypothetical protein BASA61_004312 [Batrachochytrium salamandrivorans]
MKFKVLVVAAMVITSVNAGGRGGFKGWLKPKGGMSKSESKQSLLPKAGDASQESETTKQEPTGGSNVKDIAKDRICTTIKSELDSLRREAKEVYSLLFRQIPDSYKQEKGLYTLKSHPLKDWLKQCYEDNPELLQPIKEKLVVLDEKYRSAWAELITEGCSIESRPYSVSPEEMAKRGYLSKWYN